MAVTRVRTVQMYFYTGGGKHFKVWSGHHGGWYVDVVDEGGETQETVGYDLATVYAAEEFMDKMTEGVGA